MMTLRVTGLCSLALVTLLTSLSVTELVDEDLDRCEAVNATDQTDGSLRRLGRALLSTQIKKALTPNSEPHDGLRVQRRRVNRSAPPGKRRKIIHEETVSNKETGHDKGVSLVNDASTLSAVPRLKFKTKSSVKPLWKIQGLAERPFNVEAGMRDGNLSCGVSVFAPGLGRCPRRCPYSTRDPAKGCHFLCVADCNFSKGSDESFLDEVEATCSTCKVMGCETCVAGRQICKKCKAGFTLEENSCNASHSFRLVHIVAIGAVLMGIKYISLLARPVINKDVQHEAVLRRWRSCLRNKRLPGQPWFPLNTDLRALRDKEPCVGGCGLMLFFNFQASVLCWIILVVLAWSMLGAITGKNLFVLGTLPTDSTHEVCQAIRWGSAESRRMSKHRSVFALFLYIFSFAGCILLAQRNRRLFLSARVKFPAMSNYCICLQNFPKLSGDKVESEILHFITQAVGIRPVGVSVHWDFEQSSRVITEVLRRTLEDRQEAIATQVGIQFDGTRERCLSTGSMVSATHDATDAALLFLSTNPERSDSGSDDTQDDMSTKFQETARTVLQGLRSTGSAFVVFFTKEERDRAVKTFRSPSAPQFRDVHKLMVKAESTQPGNVLWENLSIATSGKILRIILGTIAMVGLIVAFGMFCYLPFAYFEAAHVRETGTPPSLYYQICFLAVVIAGNQLTYLMSRKITSWVGFHREDSLMIFNCLLYATFIFSGVILDLAIIAWMTSLGMASARVRTEDGTLLKDLPDMISMLSAYPMAREMGRTIYEYNVHSTFILPFIIECLVGIALPYHIAYRTVGVSHTTLTQAEAALAPRHFDLMRYADIVINLTLATVSLFFSSGWVLGTFLGLLVGNAFVYGLDHWRVLRQSMHFDFSESEMDELGHHLLAVPCGMLAVFFCFRLQMHFGENGSPLMLPLMVIAFVAHVMLHILLLRLWQPKPQDYSETNSAYHLATYADAAAGTPMNWFNANPVHCLRSHFIHQDSPPCVWYVPGREDVLMKNTDIGLYYDGMVMARTTDYDAVFAKEAEEISGHLKD
eukprot:TRINITY_DN38305_c0_g1_i1.p1 TRINITY_DN38305_c0_g1~~TRINITY_DN38305_c0_g1_i1.p1  ORF type:complete len:1037 (+),score=98.89 TRINITY_DN38305_c0_g1_i1:127-3237(+)